MGEFLYGVPVEYRRAIGLVAVGMLLAACGRQRDVEAMSGHQLPITPNPDVPAESLSDFEFTPEEIGHAVAGNGPTEEVFLEVEAEVSSTPENEVTQQVEAEEEVESERKPTEVGEIDFGREYTVFLTDEIMQGGSDPVDTGIERLVKVRQYDMKPIVLGVGVTPSEAKDKFLDLADDPINGHGARTTQGLKDGIIQAHDLIIEAHAYTNGAAISRNGEVAVAQSLAGEWIRRYVQWFREGMKFLLDKEIYVVQEAEDGQSVTVVPFSIRQVFTMEQGEFNQAVMRTLGDESQVVYNHDVDNIKMPELAEKITWIVCKGNTFNISGERIGVVMEPGEAIVVENMDRDEVLVRLGQSADQGGGEVFLERFRDSSPERENIGIR